MKLYIDDTRNPPDGWTIARTNYDAIRILVEEDVEEVSIDYMIDIAGEDGAHDFLPVAYFVAFMPEDRRPKVVTIHTGSQDGDAYLRKILEGNVAHLQYKFGGMPGSEHLR